MIGKFNEVSEVAKERTSLKDSPLGKMEPVKDFMPRGDYDPPPWKRSDPIFGGEWKDLLLRQEDAQKHFGGWYLEEDEGCVECWTTVSGLH